DGVTPEMMEAQRARMRLAETFMQASPDTLPELVRQHDAEIDMQFFQILTMMAQQAMQSGRPDVAQGMINLQGQLVELSTEGQRLIAENARQEETVQAVAADVQALGQ